MGKAQQIGDREVPRLRGRKRRTPLALGIKVGGGVFVDQPHQHLGHDTATDPTHVLAVMAHLGLAQDVVPERRLTLPTELAQANLLRSKRSDAHHPGNCLAGGQGESLATNEVAVGKRVLFRSLCRANYRLRQVDQRMSEYSVDALTSLRRAVSIDIEEVSPVDGAIVIYRTGALAIWENLALRAATVEAVDLAHLAVSEAIGGIGELHRDIGTILVRIELQAV